MAADFDLIVLGSGNAGMGAAGVARAAGKTVAMVECRDVGGTCPLRGCVPKKVLVAAAQALHQIELAGIHHIEAGPARLDWPRLVEREQGFVRGVPDEFAKSLENRGIELLRGEARFVDATAVTVDGRRLQAGKVVIATGSTPRNLPIPGSEYTITSDDILVMPELPESIIFIGGGVIALEFSHVFARAGVDVTILEAMHRLLPRIEADLVEQVTKESRRIGIDILTDAQVDRVEMTGGERTVHFRHGGRARRCSAAVVANGIGRVPDVERLDLDAAGIDHEGAAIAVDDYLRSLSNADAFVAGDALAGSAQLSPLATYEGRLAGRNAVEGTKEKADYTAVPACVFTVPAAASVGLTEAEAREKGLDFAAKVNAMGMWRSSQTHAETVSWAKILVEAGSDRVLGAHMIGHAAEEVIHLFAMAMRHGITADRIAGAVYAYPTFASDIKFLV